MTDIVITEFMDAGPVERLKAEHSVLWDDHLGKDRARLLPMLANATAIIVRNETQVNEELLDAAPNLRVVGRLGVGLDNIDLQACAARNVTVCPATGANAPSVAEYVIAATFQLTRGMASATQRITQGAWPRADFSGGGEIYGKVMGLIGFGGIGQLVADKAASLGMTIVAYDPVLPADDPAWHGVERGTLSDVLAKADVISLHVPLTDETRGMIDARAFAQMKPNVILINTARGGIVDEAELAARLQRDEIGGAALDVFESEPPDPALMAQFAGQSNVLLTPHIAGLTAEANGRVSELTVDNVLRELKGQT